MDMIEQSHQALQSGTSGKALLPLVEALRSDERALLLCMLSGIQGELTRKYLSPLLVSVGRVYAVVP